MTVIVTVQVQGEPQRLEQFASANHEHMRAISDAAKGHGVIAHRFYGSEDGRILVIDEWPDAESFQRFFDDQQGPIGSMMQESGIASEPRVSFWRELETGDEIGWEG